MAASFVLTEVMNIDLVRQKSGIAKEITFIRAARKSTE